MKKYIYMFALSLMGVFGFTSCDSETDEESGGTAVENLAGEWSVTVDVVDENGDIVYEDPYGMGTVTINTYNTAANTADTMWFDDGSFYGVKMKVAVSGNTFSAPAGTCYDPGYEYANGEPGNVELLNGKVLLGQGKNIHGLPTDSICVDVKFSDDSYGFIYRYSGIRYAGFTE